MFSALFISLFSPTATATAVVTAPAEKAHTIQQPLHNEENRIFGKSMCSCATFDMNYILGVMFVESSFLKENDRKIDFFASDLAIDVENSAITCVLTERNQCLDLLAFISFWFPTKKFSFGEKWF